MSNSWNSSAWTSRKSIFMEVFASSRAGRDVEAEMRDRFLASLGGVAAVVIAVAWLAPVPVAGQAGAAAAKTTTGANAGALPRTPWGDPDLQGMWETQARTPMERPAEFGTREFMTEAEAADRARRGLDAAGGDDDEGASPAN